MYSVWKKRDVLWRYTVREDMYTCVFEKERWNGNLREDDDRVPLRFSLFRERKSSPLSALVCTGIGDERSLSHVGRDDGDVDRPPNSLTV